MTILAATPSALSPSMIVAGMVLVTVTFGYALSCWLAPFARCRRCAGAGTRKSLLGHRKPCRSCDATGWRLRAGRRIANTLRDLRDASR